MIIDKQNPTFLHTLAFNHLIQHSFWYPISNFPRSELRLHKWVFFYADAENSMNLSLNVMTIGIVRDYGKPVGMAL